MTAQPRSWLHHQGAFGYAARPQDWRPANSSAERAALAAAKQHHELVKQVRLLKPVHGLTDDDLARELAVSTATIRRYLNGTSAISLVAFHHLAQTVGLVSTTTLDSANR